MLVGVGRLIGVGRHGRPVELEFLEIRHDNSLPLRETASDVYKLMLEQIQGAETCATRVCLHIDGAAAFAAFISV